MPGILIIDDELDMCIALSDVLESEGFKVFHVQDGLSGVRKIEEEHPDLVLLDIRMPGMDGIETLKRIKNLNSTLPVIMITGYGNADSAAEVMKIGASDYISKPFDNQKILSAIKKLLAPERFKNGDVFFQRIGSKLGFGPKKERDLFLSQKRNRRKSHKIFGRAASALALVLVLGMGFFVVRTKVRAYNIPCSHPSGITVGGENILICDWFDQSVYEYRKAGRFLLVKTYHFPNLRLTGLAWDGKNLWTTDGWKKKIRRHNLDQDLSLSENYISPGSNPAAVAWDGEALWSTDMDTGMIYRHNMDDALSVNQVFEAPAGNPCGLIWDGQNIWSCDTDSRRIYRHNLDQNLTIAESYDVGSIISGGRLVGMAWDGRNMWLCTENPSRVYRFSLKYLWLKKLMGG